MKIKINGEIKEFFEDYNLKKFIEQLEAIPRYFVVAVNFECIPEHEYSSLQLKDGDEIEILTPTSGG